MGANIAFKNDRDSMRGTLAILYHTKRVCYFGQGKYQWVRNIAFKNERDDRKRPKPEIYCLMILVMRYYTRF